MKKKNEKKIWAEDPQISLGNAKNAIAFFWGGSNTK